MDAAARMADIYTEDVIGPVTLKGKTYVPDGDCVIVPTEKGEAIITLDNSSKRRRSWFYRVIRGNDSFRYASLNQMQEMLPKALGL